MNILSDKQINELYIKVKGNPKLISELDRYQKIEILTLIEKRMEGVESLHTRIVDFNPHMKDYDINNISDYKIDRKLKKTLSDESNEVTIIDKSYLSLIFDKYKETFPDETKETWLKRFVYPGEKINKINVEKEVRGLNDRLVLIAILDSIQQDPRHPDMDFNKFVSEKFGIKAYKKAKSVHKKDNPEYVKIFEGCNKILRK
jgi:hypothetical protein